MSSRKRKNLELSESPRTASSASKRARVPDSPWKSPTKTALGGPACKSTSGSGFWAIKGITDEIETHYLINWADDAIDGQNYESEWKPKKFANAAAIKAWQNKQATQNNSTVGRELSESPNKERAGRLRNLNSQISLVTLPCANKDLNITPTDNEVPTEASASRHSVEPAVQSGQSVQTVTSSLDIAQFPKVEVEVSQRGNSFDKDAFITYQSSLSVQGTQKSTGTHSDSGIGESSSSRDISPVCRRSDKKGTSPICKQSDEGGVVPDSQSLPGSSSYIQTQATSSEDAGLTQDLGEIHPHELSSGVVIPASPTSKNTSQRSRSVPTPSVTHSSPLEGAGSTLLRSISDPGSTPAPELNYQFAPSRRQNRKATIGSRTPSQASPPDHVTFVPPVSLGRIEPNLEVLVSGSTSGLLIDIGTESPDRSFGFQSSAPVDFGQQSAQTDSPSPRSTRTLSVDDHRFASETWHGGQLVSGIGNSDYRISSGSGTQAQPGFHQITSGEGAAGSEDQDEYRRPSQATTVDESILGSKDPHSPEKGNSPGKSSEDAVTPQQTAALGSTRESRTRSSPSELQNLLLPNTLDSRIPPDPPTSSDLNMSDNHQGSDTVKEESGLERLKRKIKETRANAEAQHAAQKAARTEHFANIMSSSTSTKNTDLEIKTKPSGGAVQSPRGPKSPSLTRFALSPKGPLSPARRDPPPGSPLGIRITSPGVAQSPQRERSASKIPESLPYQSLGEPSFLHVEPSGIAKDMPVAHATNTEGLTQGQTYHLSQTVTLDVLNLGPMEYVIPLSMPPRAHVQYADICRFYSRQIKAFLKSRASPSDVEEMNLVLDRVGKVTTHMDLDGGGPASQDQASAREEAAYAKECSDKFQYLEHIINFAGDTDMHMAIVARPGQLLAFLETFLKAQSVAYRRWDTKTKADDTVDRRLKVSIISSGEEGASARPPKAHLVVAFDETFDADNPQVKAIRSRETSPDQAPSLAPVLRLVVHAALEHVHLCLPTTLEPNDRLRKLVFYMMRTESFIGQVAPEGLSRSIFDLSKSAQQVVELATTGVDSARWNIPPIPPLTGLPIMESDSSLSDARSDISDEYKPEGKIRYWPNPVPPKVISGVTGEKRPYDIEYGDSLEVQAKKMKTGHLSSLNRPLGPAEGTQAWYKQSHAESSQRILELEKRMASLLADNAEYADSDPHRQKLFEQYRHTVLELRATVTTLTADLQRVSLMLDKSKEDNTSLKDANTNLEATITTHQDNLLNQPNPNVREAEQLRRQVLDLQASTAAKDKKIANLESDLGFTRDAYQAASTAAAAAQSTLTDLEARIPDLEHRAAEQKLKFRQLRDNDQNEPLRKEIKRLQELAKQRDRELTTAKMENLELKRGRQGVQTRGSSVQPTAGRSPRGSRGVSPAVAGLQPHAAVGGVPMGRALSGLGGRFDRG